MLELDFWDCGSMFSSLLQDAELSVVRYELDSLAYRRSQTGLAPSEEGRYHELCASERVLLGMRLHALR